MENDQRRRISLRRNAKKKKKGKKTKKLAKSKYTIKVEDKNKSLERSAWNKLITV